MPRPRRKQRPPGSVEFICTGRGDPGHGRNHLEWFRLVDDDGRARLRWTPRGQMGRVPVTGNRRAGEAWQTADVRCGRCRRHLKVGEERLIGVIFALAEQQETHGETPVVVDISRIENAI